MAKEKKEKKGGKLKWIIIAVVAVLVIAAVAGGGDDEVKKVSSNTNEQQTAASKSEQKEDDNETKSESDNNTSTSEESELIFSVGETAEYNDVQVSLLNITESSGSEYNTPDEGNIFVLAEFEIVNNSDKELNISSLMMFDAYQDGYSTSLSLTAEMEAGNESLDGTVAPGKKMKGTIGYEIPEGYKELEINVQTDAWSNKKIKFVYNK